MSSPVTSQPSAGSSEIPPQEGDWSTGVCSCCSDSLICALGSLCPCAMCCYTADKYGETCCLGFLPGGITAMRTHMRMTYGIEGSICTDALMVCFCGPLEMCRMAREIKIRG
ncbi:cornifelin-like [Gouania willdenowi]|uniref:Cornifelin-like n=1 Tax=Gouania willdenowi TaxID=441366 RepID=A0A8C5DR80_GOUWI|nr:cornifelin-like [Gouania willdenowi]